MFWVAPALFFYLGELLDRVCTTVTYTYIIKAETYDTVTVLYCKKPTNLW